MSAPEPDDLAASAPADPDRPTLDAAQARVLGCLVEKSITTPDAYPLSLNSLRLACNQSTNRDPVVAYDDAIVDTALAGLRELGLARRLKNPGERAIKHRHLAPEALDLAPDALAIMTVLWLRGPQTPGELKSRTDRLHPFASLDQIEATLAALVTRGFVARLERRAGQKEARWVELLTDRDAAAAIEPLDAVERAVDAALDARPGPASIVAVDPVTGESRTLAVDTPHEIEAKLERARRAQPTWAARGDAARADVLARARAAVESHAETIVAFDPHVVAGRRARDDAALGLLDALGACRSRAAADGGPAVVALVVDDVDDVTGALVDAWSWLATGAAVLVKPAPAAVLLGLALVDELHAVGVPADVVQCVVGEDPTTAALVHAAPDLVEVHGDHEAGARAVRAGADRRVAMDLRLR